MRFGLPENFDSQFNQVKNKKGWKKKAKVTSQVVKDAIFTERCHSVKIRSTYFSSENETQWTTKLLDSKEFSSGQFLIPNNSNFVLENKILPRTRFDSTPFPNQSFKSCASESESEMDWEPISDISVTINNLRSSRFMDRVPQNSLLDDSVIVLDSKPGKFSNKPVSVIDEVVVISDSEDSPPACHSTGQHDEKITEVVRKSVIHSEKSRQPNRDLSCVSSSEDCVTHSLGYGQACNRPGLTQDKLRKKQASSKPLFKGQKEDNRVVTLSLDKTVKVSSTLPTPDLKIVAVSKRSEQMVTVRNSWPSCDFLPLVSSAKSTLSKGQRRKRRLNKRSPKRKKAVTRNQKKNNAISSAPKICEVIDVESYVTSVKLGNPETASSLDDFCRASSSNSLSVKNKENSTTFSRSVSTLSRNVKKILRPIVIDGSNVAFTHGKHKLFSCKGIELCVKFFQDRGHKVTAFVPQYRRYKSKEVVHQKILETLGNSQVVVFTPSRKVNGVLINSYDDRFILDLAARTGGVVVSNDNYRDIKDEKPEWKQLVDNRLLMYLFVDDIFMVPDDPLGRRGVTLDAFLSFAV